MSVPLYLDHQVSAAIALGLRQRGIAVVTAFEDGAAAWDDERLLERSSQLGRTLFTQDKDFLVIVSRWLITGRCFAGLANAHPLHITVGQAIRDLEILGQVMDPPGMLNRIEFLPYS